MSRGKKYCNLLKKEEQFIENKDVILNKIRTIERCMNRVYEADAGDPRKLSRGYF